MLLLPYSTDLRLSQRPYVVYSIILICFIVFHFQKENNQEIENTFDSFCQSIDKNNKKTSELDDYNYKESCTYNLQTLYYYSDTEYWLDYDIDKIKSKSLRKRLKKYIDINYEHHEDLLKLEIPKSVDKMLMYYPNTFNPFKMLTSAISHADWSHIIFNLIFFFAFAPALELLARNKLKFISVFIAVELIGGFIYSITSIMAGDNIPTLGLSGSVSGMIGFSAYMMPWAKIRTFFWFLHIVRFYSIPAWILAGWYIGWDVYELFSRTENGGVNFLAHVSGGLVGYLMGYFFFKKEKEAAKYELGVEIDYMRSKRESFSNVATLYKGDTAYVDSKQREDNAKKSYGKFNEELYRHIKVGETSEALLLLLQKYDLFKDSPELYIELFNNIGEWKKKRVYLCAGRLVIDLLVENKQYSNVSGVLKSCIEVEPSFVLADPDDLVFVVNYLINTHEYELAYDLISRSKEKYGEAINECDCVLLEAKILWEYLDKTVDAQLLVNALFVKYPNNDELNNFIPLVNTT